jgi:hypothetical protein
MAYLIDNEQVYLLNKQTDVHLNQQFSKFAFVLDVPFGELPIDQQEQFTKILKSVNQDVEGTCMLSVSSTWSLHLLEKCGVKYIVVFSSQPLAVFQSANVSKHKCFSISTLEIIIISSLEIFQKSDTEKKLLWGFMKPRI